ncbi:MAG: MMPL family transporter [Thermoleophilia bacterium]
MRSLPVTRPRLVVAVVALFTVVAVVFGAAGLGGLSTQGFEDPATQAHRAADRYAAATGIDSNLTAVVLVHPDGGVTGAADPRVLAARARLAAVPGVVSVTPPSVAGNRHSALLIAAFREGTSQGTDASALRAAFRGRTDVVVGGAVIANHDITSIIGQDIGRAEMVAFPVLFLVSLLVFRGVIAALMPVVVGMVAIMGGFLGLAMANHLTSVSVFATNLVIGLGLGLAVDYALLLVSRYREEVAVHGHTPDAVRATLRSAGRSVLFSAVTVAAAMAGLMLFPQDFLFSMGLGGLMVALVAALVAVSLVPAMLMLLGPRIDALSPRRWRDSLAQRHAAPHTGAWYRLSHLVMRRALPVTVAAAAVMLALGTPALGIRFTSIDEGVLPTSSPARVAHDMLRADFPDDAADPVRILARAPATPASGAALARYAATLGNLPGVASVSRPQPLRGGTWLIQAVLAQPPLSAASERAVRDIRRAAAPVPVLVGGRTATQIDEKASLARHLPWRRA